jgi:acyl-CoA synthetase (AMP-forming)/AMP-acid ligase II
MDMTPVPAWGTIPRMLRDQADRHGDTVVARDDRRTLTMAGLRDGAARVARSLIAAGVEAGDRVAIWAPNRVSWVEVAYGVWDAGAIIVPLSTRFRGIEAAHVLAGTEASALFVEDGFLGTRYLDLLGDAAPATVVTMPESPTGSAYAEFLSHAAPAGVAEKRALDVAPGDLAEVIATSGTTGTPKGVMLDHSQLLRAYWDWSEVVTLRTGDHYPIIAPFNHGFGLNAGLIACVLRGATMTPVAVFRPDALLDMIDKDGVTILAGPPAMFLRILAERPAATSLRVAICGAAAVPPDLVRRMLGRGGLERMINAYGLMEGTVVSMTRPEDPVEVIASTTGRPVPGVAVRVVGDDGADLPAGERGEIMVAGYGVMRGYWRDPERTAETVDAGGWLHTGDIGVLDAAGNVAVVDRKKEMFIVGGFNAYPAEIEALLLRHPGVAHAAVVGVPDEALGEVPRAFVVRFPESGLTERNLIAWARDNMSNYKVPRTVEFLDALPLNVNGKVDKPLLRERARS